MSDELFELGRRLVHETTARDRTCTGELTLKIKLKADRSGLVATSYEIKRKDPSKSTTPGFAYLTAGGNLTSENPRQAELPGLREVPGGRANSPPREPTVGRDIDDRSNRAAPREV
ncbi:hypothetical protein [Sandaracinus amylolyticus]|uniref:hypothetical protein n=1 Tax=Sandaracinus amylolyticus TaxID=927083 RepID=UPI001F41B597|nr:hypothetical protein [Sandaracinus amylolyticus]